MTRYYDTDFAVLDAVEDTLEAYAHTRYTPSGPVLSRMRAVVMAQANAAAALSAANQRLLDIDVTERAGWTIGRLRLPVFQLPRRAIAMGMAAALTFGTSAAVLAAPPGSAFYNARVVLQAVLLPTQVEARLAAHEQHLQERLAEAGAAAAWGDAAGLQAALAAYQAEVDAAVADAGASSGLLAHLEAMLAKHVAVLTALEAEAPEQASIDRALDVSQKAIVRIKEKGGTG
ncbi:MAG TPA: hypothetical protein VM451_00755, partial [Candidatus Limnocylindria bacterium]|nr:hypothetical protein [Candidatus Limnocylindria bacterium]